jgi:hypothetical protein
MLRSTRQGVPLQSTPSLLAYLLRWAQDAGYAVQDRSGLSCVGMRDSQPLNVVNGLAIHTIEQPEA